MTHTIITDKDGLYIGPRRTYRLSGQVVAALGAFPFIVVGGAAGRVIRIKRIRIGNVSLTAAAILRVLTQKLSALPTGGTSTGITKVPLDSAAQASSAIALAYTVAPTAGTIVGQISDLVINAVATLATAGADDKIIDYGVDQTSELCTLRTAAEGISLAFAAAASAVTLSYIIEYTEDGN